MEVRVCLEGGEEGQFPKTVDGSALPGGSLFSVPVRFNKTQKQRLVPETVIRTYKNFDIILT